MVELPQRPGGPAAAAVTCEARAASAMSSDMPSASKSPSAAAHVGGKGRAVREAGQDGVRLPERYKA